MIRLVAWLLLGAATAGAAVALTASGFPSATIFAALVLGVAVALWRPGMLTIGDRAMVPAQAVTGVVLGCYLQSDALGAVADAWLAVALVTAGTVVLCLLFGYLIAQLTEVDTPTAALGMVAGGASGIITMARELGADARLVAFMQYARLLLVIAIMPLLVALFFTGQAVTPAGADTGPFLGVPSGWAIAALLAAVGAVLGTRLRLPAGLLIAPLLLSAAVTLSTPPGTFALPPLLRETAFAAIGLSVGLGFTVETFRQIGRLLLPVVLSLIGLLVSCFGLAAILAATTELSLLDAYLATTPGGIYVVLATSVGVGAETTFVVAVQGLRLIAMVVLAPFAVRLLVSLGRRNER